MADRSKIFPLSIFLYTIYLSAVLRVAKPFFLSNINVFIGR